MKIIKKITNFFVERQTGFPLNAHLEDRHTMLKDIEVYKDIMSEQRRENPTQCRACGALVLFDACTYCGTVAPRSIPEYIPDKVDYKHYWENQLKKYGYEI